MITDLRTKIYQTGITVSGSNGRFYYADEPDDVTYPFVKYYLVDDVYDRVDTQIYEDVILIQFSLFDRRITSSGQKISSVSLETLAEELIAKFNAINLTITGYTSVDLVREYTRPAVVSEDGLYWQVIIQYRLILNK